MRHLLLPFMLLISVVLASCAGSRGLAPYGLHGFWLTNRFDRHGRETGRWRTYYDDARHQPFTAGRYRHGQPVRSFRYYDPTGQLDRTETYTRDGYCEVTYWYPGGQVARRGPAQWVTGGRGAARFYWYGTWTSYDPAGQVTAVQTYVDGTQTRGETYEQGQLTQIETFDQNKHIRVETYTNGQLIKVETYEKGLRTGITNTL